MNPAVALVQAYLRLNGYFTIAEFPIVEAMRHGGHRTLTDIDLLAFRFAGAQREPSGGGRRTVDPERHDPDPRLVPRESRADMIIGEVKEGSARLNKGARDPVVLRAALIRFGCCTAEEADAVVTGLLRDGQSDTRAGHGIRMIVFGSVLDEPLPAAFEFVPLGHVVTYLEQHMAEHWDLLRHSQTTDPVLAFLLLLEKARRGDGGA